MAKWGLCRHLLVVLRRQLVSLEEERRKGGIPLPKKCHHLVLQGVCIVPKAASLALHLGGNLLPLGTDLRVQCHVWINLNHGHKRLLMSLPKKSSQGLHMDSCFEGDFLPLGDMCSSLGDMLADYMVMEEVCIIGELGAMFSLAASIEVFPQRRGSR